MTRPLFFFDYNSPYAYLAAARIGDLLPDARWRPIAFGFLLRDIGRVPWSLRPGREAEMRQIEERAAARALPELRWPPGWPDESWSLLAMRAAVFAEGAGRLREFSAAAFRLLFAEGRSLKGIDGVLDAARAAGLDPEDVADGIARDDVKSRLREYTDDAVARGVVGVPTVLVGDELFWGDDRLEDAVARSSRAA